MSKEETFYIEEYKALRQEIATKLKDRLEYSRWGLIALAALYGYITSNPENTAVFWVPVALSAAMIFHFNEEHRMVARVADYIREQSERWISGGDAPQGWETFLQSPGSSVPRWWQKRWPWPLWDWAPVPMWTILFFITLLIAIVASLAR